MCHSQKSHQQPHHHHHHRHHHQQQPQQPADRQCDGWPATPLVTSWTEIQSDCRARVRLPSCVESGQTRLWANDSLQWTYAARIHSATDQQGSPVYMVLKYIITIIIIIINNMLTAAGTGANHAASSCWLTSTSSQQSNTTKSCAVGILDAIRHFQRCHHRRKVWKKQMLQN